MLHRYSTVLFLVTVCSLAAPALAPAATVSVGSSGPVSGGVLVEAMPGETNTLTVSATSTGAGRQQTTFRDETALLVAGKGCNQAAPDTVTCETSASPYAEFQLQDGNDRLTFVSNAFYSGLVHGGDGDDVITDNAIGDSAYFGGQVFGDAGNDQLAARGSMHGGSGNDRLEGTPGSDTLVGGAGNDALFGREGKDSLYGGNGPSSSPVLAGVDSLNGGAGDDAFADEDRGSATVQQINADVIVGGEGNDNVLSYQNRVADVIVDLQEPRRDGQRGEGDDLSGVEGLFGGDGDDWLYGDGDGNYIAGGAGKDDIGGRGGKDTLVSTNGDTAAGDVGRDRILLSSDATGYANCGSGKDAVLLDVVAPYRRPEEAKNGARISKTCERAMWRGRSFKPTPARIRQSGLLTFAGLPFRGERFTLTRSTRPFVAIARLRIPSGRFSVQLPRDLIRKHKKVVRVVIDHRVIYRFRLGG